MTNDVYCSVPAENMNFIMGFSAEYEQALVCCYQHKNDVTPGLNMFSTYIKDQNIFTENKPSALPRILFVNTVLALMAGIILWAVLQRNFELNNQALTSSADQAQTVMANGLHLSSPTLVSATNLDKLN